MKIPKINYSFLNIFSYKCDDYVSNEVDIQTIDKIRQSIMKIRDKENTEPNSNVEEIENIDKHEEPSCRSSSELELSNKLELSPIMEDSAVTPDMEPSVSEPANMEAGGSEMTECKTSKLNKVFTFFPSNLKLYIIILYSILSLILCSLITVTVTVSHATGKATSCGFDSHARKFIIFICSLWLQAKMRF